MTISFVGSGTFNATTDPIPTYSAGGATDILVGLVGGKDFNTTCATPASWAAYTGVNPQSGSTGGGAGTGSVYSLGFYEDGPGTGSSTVTFDCSAVSNPGMAGVLRFARSAGSGWTTSAIGLTDTDETGTTVSATGTAASGQFASGDWIVIQVPIKDDAPNHTSQSLTIAGCTVGTITWLSKFTTTFGQDGALYTGYAAITAGSSSGSVTYGATSSVSGAAATAPILVSIRETSSGGAPDTPQKPLIVGAVEVPQQPPYLFVERPLVEQVAAPTGTPPRPIVVASQPLPQPPATVLVGRPPTEPPAAPTGSPARPLIVGAQQVPQQRPVVIVEQPTIEAATPTDSIVVTAQPLPTAKPFVLVEQPLAAAVVAVVGAPRPIVVAAQPLPTQRPYSFIGKPAAEQVADTVPPQPTISAGAGAAGGGTVFVAQTFVGPAAPAAGTPTHPLVVSAQPLPQQRPAIIIEQPTIEAATPPRPVIVGAQPPAQYTQQPTVWRARVDPAPQPPVPIKPTIISAQQPPQEPAYRFVGEPPVSPVVAAGTPPRPVVIGSVTSVPQPGTAWINRPVATETYRPQPLVVTQTVKPPEVAAAFISRTTASFPAGIPPKPTVSLAGRGMPSPTGWALVRHGFAEALPILSPIARVETGATRHRGSTEAGNARASSGPARRRSSTGDDAIRVSTGNNNSRISTGP